MALIRQFLAPSLALLLLFLSSCASATGPALCGYNVDRSRVTVSGISAGAAFATQFHVGYSSSVSGAGTWAGVPGDLCFAFYFYGCMTTPSLVSAELLALETELLADVGRIDAVQNIQDDRVYIFHGTGDETVRPGAAEVLEDFYAELGISDPASQILSKTDLNATHALASDHSGTPCGEHNDELYIENCDYESPFFMLDHLLGGGLNLPVPPGSYLGQIEEFDQEEFFLLDPHSYSMNEFGYVYVPPQCQDDANQCLLHIFFHGCSLHADEVGTEFIVESGFLEVADANNIVMLFPQAESNSLTGDPFACFDWFGYTNVNLLDPLHYATHGAPQMDAAFQMLQRASRA